MRTLENLKVIMHGLRKQIRIKYKPMTDQVLYDICDLSGRIILTGSIIKEETLISVNDLMSNQYIILILDGDQAISKKFSL